MSTQKIKVTIFGESYTLVTDEPEEFVRSTAATVDGLMSEMAKRIGQVDGRKLAIFAALQLASKKLSLEQEVSAKTRLLAQQIDGCLGS